MPSPKSPSTSGRVQLDGAGTMGNWSEHDKAGSRVASGKGREPSLTPRSGVVQIYQRKETYIPAGAMRPGNQDELSTEAKVEMILSLLAAVDFLILLFYLYFARCVTNTTEDYYMKIFALVGIFAALFIFMHRALQRRELIVPGGVGFLIFFFITGVILANFMGVYWAVSCMCQCPSTANAFIARQREDFMIFLFEITGSLLLVVILVNSAIADTYV